LITILVFYLALSQISINICGTLTRNHRYRSTKRRGARRGPGQNKWYNFFVGLIFGLAGAINDIAALNECVPPDWQAVDTAKIEPEGAPQEKSLLTKILDGIEGVINFVCAFKGKIAGMLGRRIRRWVRRHRYRMFFGTGLRRRWGFLSKVGNWFKGAANTIKNTAVNVGNSIKNGVVKAANAVKDVAVKVGNAIKATAENVYAKIKEAALSVADWAKKAWETVKNLATAFITKIKEFWSKAVSAIKNFFSMDTFNKIKNIMMCAFKLKGLATGLFSLVKGFINRVQQIAQIAAQNYAMIAKIIIDLICNFSLFRQAIGYLIDSISEPDTTKKFSLIGKFIGSLIRALVTRRRIRYFLKKY
jgi:phage-related protein